MKPSIETLANFFAKKFHNNYHLEFDKSVKRYSNNIFTLEIYDSIGRVTHFYLVIPIDRLFAESSQPFHQKIMKYFEDVITFPPQKYLIGYIEVDADFLPIDAQRFLIPRDSDLLRTILN